MAEITRKPDIRWERSDTDTVLAWYALLKELGAGCMLRKSYQVLNGDEVLKYGEYDYITPRQVSDTYDRNQWAAPRPWEKDTFVTMKMLAGYDKTLVGHEIKMTYDAREYPPTLTVDSQAALPGAPLPQSLRAIIDPQFPAPPTTQPVA